MSTRIAITGAAHGLGRAIAEAVVAAGVGVVLVDHDDGAARRTALEIGPPGADVPVVVADLATEQGVRDAAHELLEHQDLSGLVNNAGGWLSGDQYPEAEPETWTSALSLNLVAPMLLTQLLWPRLAAASGAVVNIGSSGGTGPESYGSPEYAAAKAGIRRFTASLSGRSDVRVTAVVPGWIGLDRAQRQWTDLPPEERARTAPLIPPDRVTEVVVRLLVSGRSGEVVEL